MAFSITTTLPLLLLLLLLFTISASARPCKTIFFFSTSTTTTTPQNPSSSTPHLITFYLTTPNPNNPHPNNPNRFFLIPHARHTRLTFDRIGVENQHPHHHHHLDHDHQLQHPHQPSMKERTMDVMSVVGALLFGMGCGALTAATMYLVWSLFVPNRFDEEDEVDEEEEEVEFDEDLYNTKKIAQNGYVAVANDVVVDDQVHGGGVGKEGE